MKKILSKTVLILGVIMLAWFLSSWCEVLAKNVRPDPQYSQFNMFVLALEVFE